MVNRIITGLCSPEEFVCLIQPVRKQTVDARVGDLVSRANPQTSKTIATLEACLSSFEYGISNFVVAGNVLALVKLLNYVSNTLIRITHNLGTWLRQKSRLSECFISPPFLVFVLTMS